MTRACAAGGSKPMVIVFFSNLSLRPDQDEATNPGREADNRQVREIISRNATDGVWYW